jgi:alpha-glucosidase
MTLTACLTDRASAYMSLIMVLGAWWPQAVLGQTPTTSFADATTSYRSIFAVPAAADNGQPVLPNVKDPEAVNAQSVCPGYIASGVQQTSNGITAYLDLAGPACNVYGNDVENLTLLLDYQATDRVHIEIQPRYLGPNNETWFTLPEELVPKPESGSCSGDESDLVIEWSNDPTFSFTIKRQGLDDPLFTTSGSVLVYEDQFTEFGSVLPYQYSLYGLGESIHDFRLSGTVSDTAEPTNLTRKN